MSHLPSSPARWPWLSWVDYPQTDPEDDQGTHSGRFGVVPPSVPRTVGVAPEGPGSRLVVVWAFLIGLAAGVGLLAWGLAGRL